MRVNIDGKQIETQERKTILELARENNIYIPSLCDFKGLEPFSGCRLCLVKVDGIKDYVPSCSTYIEEGMRVQTKTPDIIRLRKNILELILTEHPNACLICEEKDNCDEHKATIRKVDEVTGCVLCPNNGRCELQRVTQEIGLDSIRFPSVYRNFEIEKDDPFFDRNHNLCILCGRCVRVCQEIRGFSILSFIRRGTKTIIGTSLDKSLFDSGCQFCGACVDACPTGALTEKAIKYDSLPDRKRDTVCPLCSIGCNIRFNFHKDKLLGVDVVDTSPVNQGQACVRGRFALRDMFHNGGRIRKPLIRKGDHLEETTWDKALDYASQKLKTYKPNQIAVVTSPQMSCEDIYVFNEFARKVLKTEHINGKTARTPLSLISDAGRKYGISIPIHFKLDEISELDTLLMFGGNILESNPIVWLKIYEAVTHGANFITVGSLESPMHRYASKKLRIIPGMEAYFIACVLKCLIEERGNKEFPLIKGYEELEKSLDSISLDALKQKIGVSLSEVRQLVKLIKGKQKLGFIFGPQFIFKQRAEAATEALLDLAFLINARIFPLSAECNERGWYSINQEFSDKPKSSRDLIHEVEKGSCKALYAAAPVHFPEDMGLDFLIVQDSFMSPHMDKADVVLPAAVLSETDGTIVNTEGRIQSLGSPLDMQAEAKPDWKILVELAERMGLKDICYNTAQEIREKMSREVPAFKDLAQVASERKKGIFLKESFEYRKKFIPIRSINHLKKTTPKYPLRLILEYNLDYYRSCVLSKKIVEFRIFRDSQWIKMNRTEAGSYDLEEGDLVVLESAEGQFKGYVHLSEFVPDGILTSYYLPDMNEDIASWDLMPVEIARGK